MNRPWNGAMPVLLTLPLRIEHYRRVRRRRRRRVAIAALLALALGFLAAVVWMPAKAELAQHLLGDRDKHFRALAELELGDSVALERPDGTVLTYTVDALDVVDSGRAELPLDPDESVVVLVTCWPFDGVEVGGSWRYVVTARQRF
jgi:hypothetical protein